MREDKQSHNSNVVSFDLENVDFTDLVANAKSPMALYSACGRIGHVLGFPNFLVLNVPDDGQKTLSELGLLTNWSSWLISQYDDHLLLEDSAVFEHLRKSTEPFVWDINTLNAERKDEKSALITHLFKQFGLHYGVYFSVHLPDGKRGAVSFSGSEAAPDNSTLLQLNRVSSAIYTKINKLYHGRRADEFHITELEMKVLRDFANGATTAQISERLAFSEHALGHLVDRIVSKLGCRNIIQAVHKAGKLRIIN